MHYYELLSLVAGSKTDEALKASEDSIRQMLEKYGAVIHRHKLWEKRKLAYPVAKERQGVYFVTEFELEPTKLNEVDRVFQLDKEFLRHQIVSSRPRSDADRAEEARRIAEPMDEPEDAAKAKKAEEPKKIITKEELDEKLAEILTDDMVK